MMTVPAGELVLLRKILPFSAVGWAVAAVMYFSGLTPLQGPLGLATLQILRTLTYVGGFGLALAVVCVAIFRPPRVKLVRRWVWVTIANAVVAACIAVAFISFFTGR
ncbi:hypothetical protein [Burkholderia sp. Ac-20365]|uniref:hypothetical protein n=1 Tax=Burkholderia sp. Ac-20365 TaxID=2703897 RepID=UPI00197BF158|nr:hypothetical protein [Burkholderia sp. Ac-20365]MBN3761169.1 hypothetical protein [Burkholderia sp. Ac-20365]